MRVRVQRTEHGIVVPIPSAIADELGLEPGSEVDVLRSPDRVEVGPAARYRLDDLLSGITPENLHPELLTRLRDGAEPG